MRRGGLLSACLLILFLIFSGSLAADEVTEQIESRVIESFDDEGASPWVVQGSKFSTVEETDNGTVKYPRFQYVEQWPEALFRTQPEGADLMSLGVRAKFDRQGYNTIELIPVEEDENGELKARNINIPGRAKAIDLWVWGSQHDLNLKIFLMDFNGTVHVIDMGSLNYTGWKNLQARIPGYINQSVRQRPSLRPLSLVKLVVTTGPTAKVDDFFVYFDHIKVLTDLHENPFDGEALANPEYVEELWGQ